MKKNFKFNLDFILFMLMLLGLFLTLIYIFYTSTALLASDSVLANVVTHQQVLNRTLLLNHWYYGNDFFLFSINIPIYFLSFFVKNVRLLKQIGSLFIAILFFILLYQVGKRFLGKREGLLSIIIFLTGVSYSVLDYFYAWDTCLPIVVQAILLLYLYYRGIDSEERKKFYYILSLIFTFLFTIGNLLYLPLVIFPFLLTKCFIYRTSLPWKKLGGIFLVSVVAFFSFHILCINNSYNPSKVAEKNEEESIRLGTKLESIIDMNLSFFGYDNRDHVLSKSAGSQYFLQNHQEYSIVSIHGIVDFIQLAANIFFMIVVPTLLYKNYKKNSKSVNFLLLFNSIVWIIMILYYILSSHFHYNSVDLKYFLFLFVINIMLGTYIFTSYFSKYKLYSFLCGCFLISYLVSNLYTTGLVIKNHNQQEINRKMELVELLKKNHLTFGYGSYYNSLLTSYLSNYQITVANVQYQSGIVPYSLYSDERWYNKKGKVFFIFDERNIEHLKTCEKKYGVANKILTCDGYTVLVYYENPVDFEMK